MNLIEKLGGYELAKQVFESVPKDGNSYTVTRDDTGASFHSGDIFKALLQYRREHNIFEVGDKVVKASRLNDDKVYLVSEVADSLNWVKTSCGAFIDAPMFKHATDEEIQAGRRL